MSCSVGFILFIKRVYFFFVNLEINEMVCYILFIMFFIGNVLYYINMKMIILYV